MKHYFILSLAIHLFLIFGIVFVNKGTTQKEQVQQQKQEDKRKQVTVDVTIVPLDNGPKKLNEVPAKFYWGIGISSQDHTYMFPGIGTFPNSRTITEIGRGYTAEAAGLQIGDIIILIDEQNLTLTNDLRGEGPRRMNLTVYRNGVIIRVSIERTKIYYK